MDPSLNGDASKQLSQAEQTEVQKVKSVLDMPLVEDGFNVSTKFYAKGVKKAEGFEPTGASTIGTFEGKVGEIPVPKKFALAAKKKALAEKKKEIEEYKAAGLEIPAHLKKKKVDKKRYPEQEPLPPPEPVNVEQSLNDTAGWKASYQVSQKFASGTLSTAKYSEKT